MCTNITDLYLLSNILYYIFEEKQILTYSVRLMYCCIHHFQQFQFTKVIILYLETNC